MKTLKKYLITLGIETVLVFCVFFLQNLFSETDPAVIFRILCDAFTGVGFVTFGYGLLVFTSNEGAFDGLTYAVGSFINIFRKYNKRKYETYYDFKSRRAEKKMSFGYIVLSGLLFMAIGLIMLWPYHSFK